MELAKVTWLLIAVLKSVPGVALVLWAGWGPCRFSNAFLNGVIIVGYAVGYYLFAFQLSPLFYIDTAVIVCLLAMAVTSLLFKRPVGISCMLGASSALCLQMMQALVIAGVQAFVSDIAPFVSSFSLPNMLVEPICCLLSLPVVAVIRHYILADGGMALKPTQLAWLIPPLCVYLCVTLWQIPHFEEVYLEIDWMPLLLMMVMTVSGVSAIVFPLYMLHAAQQRFELERREADARRYYESVLKQRASDDDVRRLVHDMRNQIAVALETTDKTVREEHLDELERSVAQLRFVSYTGDPTIDAVLNQKRRVALGKSIDYHVTPLDLTSLGLSSVDACSLFGNALDNAIEACGPLADGDSPYIDVKLSERGGHAVIVVANSCTPSLVGRFAPDDLETRKPDKKAHGYGLANMAHVVEKSHGAMSIDAADGVFRVSIMLPKQGAKLPN